MMWFVMVSPGTFFIIMFISLLASVVYAVWDGCEDTRLLREDLDRLRNPHNPYSELEARLTEALTRKVQS